MEFLTNAVGAMAFASEVFYALVKKSFPPHMSL